MGSSVCGCTRLKMVKSPSHPRGPIIVSLPPLNYATKDSTLQSNIGVTPSPKSVKQRSDYELTIKSDSNGEGFEDEVKS